jgi:formylglycine-generating enzyme required for sulfatase activity
LRHPCAGLERQLLNLLKGKGLGGKIAWLAACGIIAAIAIALLHHPPYPADAKKQSAQAAATTPASLPLAAGGVAPKVKPDAGKVITNSIGMEFTRIEPGRFMMGSPEAEEERDKNEKQHTRLIGHAFYMGTTTVTQKQWKAVMGNDNNPSQFKGDDLPVEKVSWNDAMEYIGKLNVLEKATGRRYRLPSEGEWEYACRAGTMTPFSFGATISAEQANYRGTEIYGGGQKGDYRRKTANAKSFQPNPWGLYQMHGNVRQWCATDWKDDYGDGEIADGQENEPINPTKSRVLRGGSWGNSPRVCRSAYRYRAEPGNRDIGFGFRLCLDSP